MITASISDRLHPPARDTRVLERLPGGGYVYSLVDERVRIEARHLRRERSSLHAEIDVQCPWPGARRVGASLTCADWNLSSQTTRKTLAKHCAERARSSREEFDWQQAIDAAAIAIIAAEREPDAPMVLDDAPALTEANHDIHGLLVPADAPSLLIAHGDSLKSMLTLYALGTLAQRGLPVLYLDWEWTADRHRARKIRLFGADRIDALHYLRCRAPLVTEADHVRRYCDQRGIRFLGVDSVGLAADGPLKDDDVAIRFYRALGLLPPALCAAHVPKSSLGPDGKDAGAFGSVFWTNLARMCWQVKKTSADDDCAVIGLFPAKQNDGARVKPVGFRFRFSDAITVTRTDLADVEELAAKLPLADRIAAALRSGPLTYAAIADELGAKVDSVVKAVNRSKRFTRVPQTDGVLRFALVQRESA